MKKIDFLRLLHCVKSVQIRSFFWSVLIQENMDQKNLRVGTLFTQRTFFEVSHIFC